MATSSATATAQTVPGLLEALQSADARRPRITWYGPGGERVELSAKTLANWVAKSANLFVDELDVHPGVGAEPGTRVLLALPVHWKAVVLDLAARAAGAAVSLDPKAPVEVVVTDTTEGSGAAADRVLVVALGALARSYVGPLGDGIDYAAEVAGHDDVFVPHAPARLDTAPPACPPGARVLVRTNQPDALAVVLDVLRADGSVVLAVPEISDEVLAAEHVMRAR